MKTILCYFAIILVLFTFYFNQGCIAPEPTPTPTLTPTVAPTETPEPTLTPTPKIFLIKPGIGIENIEIDKSNASNVKEWLGEPAEETTEEGYIKLIYKKENLTFWFASKDQLLKSIQIENEDYKTAEGIGIGSRIVDVTETYKGVLNSENIYYADDGTDYYYGIDGVTIIYLSKRDPLIPTPLPTATPLPTSTPTPGPSIPEDYISSAKEAIKALQALNSVVTAGVNYENYGNRKIDAQIAVDNFLNNYPTEYIKDLKVNIYNAMECYNDAGMLWGEHILNNEEIDVKSIYNKHSDLEKRVRQYVRKNYPGSDIDAVTYGGPIGCELAFHYLWEDAEGYTNEALRLLNETAR